MFGKHFDLNESTLSIVEEIGRHIPGGFFIYQAGGNEELFYANQTVFELFGCDGPEDFKQLTGYTFRGIVHPDDYDSVTASIHKQISRGNLDYVEYRIIRKDGSVRWVDDYGHFTESDVYGGIYYVFVSDITEKREQMQKDTAVRNAVIETLTNVYHTVWLINDIETESCSLYHGDTGNDSVHADAIRRALSHPLYSDTQKEYVRTMVAEEDRERMMEQISLPYILRQLSDKKQYTVTYTRILEEGPRYYRIDIGKVAMPEGKTGIMMGFKDVDNEVRKDQELEKARRREIEGQRQREQQNSMIVALSSDYQSVFYVNLDQDEAVCYLDDNAMINTLTKLFYTE